jgi:putative ABC transport system permease protein
MIRNFFKTLFRSFWKSKTVSLINIIGLSVGMAAAVQILLWVQNEIGYDRDQAGGRQIFRVTNHLTVSKGVTWVWESSPYPLAELAKKEIPNIERTARIEPVEWNSPVVQVNDQKFSEKNCAYIDEGWLDMFHYDFLEGNKMSFIQNPFSLILTSSKAKKYFGNQSALGQIIRIDTINYLVRGVIKDNPLNSSFQFDILIPLSAKFSNPKIWKNDNGWSNFNYLTFLQLRNDVLPATVEKKLTGIVLSNKKKSEIFVSLVRLPDIHFETDLQNSSFIHTDRKIVYIFSILAALLLLIACINYVNLTTARAQLRAKEISVRKIVGAGRRQLFAHFMAESLVVSLIALCVTILLVELSLPLFNQLTERHFELPLTSGALWKVLSITLLMAALLNGVYPAILLSSFKPMNVFRGNSLLKVKDISFRKGLVVGQFTIAVILIVGTVVIFKQLSFIQQANANYNRSQIFEINLPSRLYEVYGYDGKKLNAFTSTFKNELMAQAPIGEIAQSSQSIIDLGGFSSGGFDWDGRDKDFNPTFTRLEADVNFQKIFGIQVIEGRWFRPGDKEADNGFILNETAVKDLHFHKPWVGQRFVGGGDTGRIIGIVKDFHYKSMHEKIGPLIIQFDPSGFSFFVKTNPANIASALAASERVWNRLITTDPFTYTFLDESFDRLYKNDRKASLIIFIFSAIAILISGLGLFALATFTSDQRRKEIGIRKVLGASLGSIVALLSRDFIQLVGLGILFSVPIAWWAMDKWLQDFAYRVNIGWWMFGLAGGMACIIALFAVSFQAIKAAHSNPVAALKSE